MRGLCAPPGRRKLLFARQLGIARRVVGSGETARRSIPGAVIAAEGQPLGVIEDVEGLRAEFERTAIRSTGESA